MGMSDETKVRVFTSLHELVLYVHLKSYESCFVFPFFTSQPSPSSTPPAPWALELGSTRLYASLAKPSPPFVMMVTRFQEGADQEAQEEAGRLAAKLKEISASWEVKPYKLRLIVELHSHLTYIGTFTLRYAYARLTRKGPGYLRANLAIAYREKERISHLLSEKLIILVDVDASEDDPLFRVFRPLTNDDELRRAIISALHGSGDYEELKRLEEEIKAKERELEELKQRYEELKRRLEFEDLKDRLAN